MKQTIEAPWSIGDIGWAILRRSIRKKSTCDKCEHSHDDSYYEQVVRECQVDAISIHIDARGIKYWYTAGFNIGETYNGSRFTYGTNSVENIYATREEAEKALEEEQ